jgi:15-cis-phytoene synthase
MQLTNIARDVGEDARAGRLYLPREWLAQAGINPDDWLTAPRFAPALGRVVQRLLDVADQLYARAEIGIAGLPVGCRPGIFAARLLYAEIGREINRNGLDSVSRRAVVSPARKLRLLAGLAASLERRTVAEPMPCIEQARFLMEDIVEHKAAAAEESVLRWWNFHAQAIWMLDLFERLERRRASALPDAVERMTA